jgi:hypothetical protein
VEGGGNKAAAVDGNKADAATNLGESVPNNSRAKIGPVSSSTMPQQAS